MQYIGEFAIHLYFYIEMLYSLNEILQNVFLIIEIYVIFCNTKSNISDGFEIMKILKSE